MPGLFWGRTPRNEGRPAIAPRTDEEILECLRQIPRYRVLLHNDDYNTMDHVVIALLRTIPSLTYADAVRIMLDAHTSGHAQVTVCPKEHAEYYREGLERYALTASIEPV